MKAHHSQKICRFVRISQLLGRAPDTLAPLNNKVLQTFLRKSFSCRSCQPLIIAGGAAAGCSDARATDLLEVLALLVPGLSRSGLDVVVLDGLESVPCEDLSRLVNCVKQLLKFGLCVVVVVEGTDGRPIELSSFREVVCNDELLDIILRALIGKESPSPARVLTGRVESFPTGWRRHDRTKQGVAA